jgi:hypothetical protein
MEPAIRCPRVTMATPAFAARTLQSAGAPGHEGTTTRGHTVAVHLRENAE